MVPSFQPKKESFVNTTKKFLKNRSFPFPTAPYFTSKLEFVSNILSMIVILTISKKNISKGNTREITCRDYKNFDPLKINNEVKIVLTKENMDSGIKFFDVLDKDSPL